MNHQINLANRFREVILNGTWIANTNFKDQLEKLDYRIAIAKFQNLNTISDLAQHIHYYIKGVKNVLLGGNLEISDQYSFDFPPIESQQQWENFLENFLKDSEEFSTLIETLPQEKLNEDFVEKKYGTYLRNLDGMIEHCYYHLGQIALIKKIINQK